MQQKAATARRRQATRAAKADVGPAEVCFHALPGALMPNSCLCVGHRLIRLTVVMSDWNVMLQDPFATKEVYHDGPFAQFMINTFSNRMSSLLGGESYAHAGKVFA